MNKFYSIARSPGVTGTYYYNSFFQSLKLKYRYEALQADRIEDVLDILKAPYVLGISVSMPFKKQAVSLLDEADFSVEDTGSCNTIRVVNGKWIGYNTDLAGVRWAVANLPSSGRIQILGDGAMSSMFQNVLNLEGREFQVFSRSLGNWEGRNTGYQIAINATALGTISSESPIELSDTLEYVVDLSLKPGELHSGCLSRGIQYISGLEFYKNVFMAQFLTYLGERADPNLFDAFTTARKQD